MLNIFKKKINGIYTVCDGDIISLDQVADPVFSQRLLGDGFGVIPTSDYVVAPFDGEVIMIFPTKHAIGLRSSDGIEVLIHVGLDTVNENGVGFEIQVREKDKVKMGTTLLKFEREKLLAKNYDVTIATIITNMDKIAKITPNLIKNGKICKSIALEYSKV